MLERLPRRIPSSVPRLRVSSGLLLAIPIAFVVLLKLPTSLFPGWMLRSGAPPGEKGITPHDLVQAAAFVFSLGSSGLVFLYASLRSFFQRDFRAEGLFLALACFVISALVLWPH
jgi:hypothetical protein